MRKIVTHGSDSELDVQIAYNLLAMNQDNNLTRLAMEDYSNPNKYMMQNVFLTDEGVDLELLDKILVKCRTIIYVGKDMNIDAKIRSFVEEKGIPAIESAFSIANGASAWKKDGKIIESYTSSVYTIPELVCKYVEKVNVKIAKLIRYYSQFKTQRPNQPFDHYVISELETLYNEFVKYHETHEQYNEEELIQLFNQYGPN